MDSGGEVPSSRVHTYRLCRWGGFDRTVEKIIYSVAYDDLKLAGNITDYRFILGYRSFGNENESEYDDGFKIKASCWKIVILANTKARGAKAVVTFRTKFMNNRKYFPLHGSWDKQNILYSTRAGPLVHYYSIV